MDYTKATANLIKRNNNPIFKGNDIINKLLMDIPNNFFTVNSESSPKDRWLAIAIILKNLNERG